MLTRGAVQEPVQSLLFSAADYRRLTSETWTSLFDNVQSWTVSICDFSMIFFEKDQQGNRVCEYLPKMGTENVILVSWNHKKAYRLIVRHWDSSEIFQT